VYVKQASQNYLGRLANPHVYRTLWTLIYIVHRIGGGGPYRIKSTVEKHNLKS